MGTRCGPLAGSTLPDICTRPGVISPPRPSVVGWAFRTGRPHASTTRIKCVHGYLESVNPVCVTCAQLRFMGLSATLDVQVNSSVAGCRG